jgi:hypothetical protein
MTAPPPSPAADETSDVPAPQAERTDRAWSVRVYGVVVLTFLLWVALLVVLQRTFS